MIQYNKTGKLTNISINLWVFRISIGYIGINKFTIRFEISWGWSTIKYNRRKTDGC